MTAVTAVTLGTVGVGLLLGSPTSTAAAPVTDEDTGAADVLRPAADVALEASSSPALPGDARRSPAATPLTTTPPDPEETVTTIVRSEPRAWWDFVGTSQRVVDAVRGKADADRRTNRDVTIVREYRNAFEGFAVDAPRWAIETIREAGGVAAAFEETRYTVPVSAETTALDSATYEWANGSSLAMTGADQAGVRGEGMLVSIIDTGLDTSHPAFSGAIDPATAELSASGVDALRSRLGAGAGARYVDAKVPFAYDYADADDEVAPQRQGATVDLSHGTHVAGIAAANGGDEIRGTAPGAQIMVQKVFDDVDGLARDSVILAALDDAAEVRPDVINLSLGSDSGFSRDRDGIYSDIYQALRDRGVIVSAAAGNSAHAGIANRSGKNLPYATDPDYGVLAAPASYDSALAVASIDNAPARPYVEGAEGARAHIVTAAASPGGRVVPFAELPKGVYPYASAGEGRGDEIAAAVQGLADAGIEPADAILLIRRGGDNAGRPMTFQDKVDNAAAVGPAAVLFVDNVDTLPLVTPELVSSTIPAAAVSRAEGEALLAAATKTLRVDPAQLGDPDTRYTASSFSSRGVTPELELKPDIAAPGGSIYSAIPGGGYERKSGTSMASPQMAGILALVKQKVLADDRYGALTQTQAADLARQLVMNTAVPVKNPAAADAEYSPRTQGAGLANVPAAISTPVTLSVVGAVDPARPSASLGDSTAGTFDVEILAHNRSDRDQTYTVDASALSDRIADGLFQGDAVDWAGSGIEVTFRGDGVDGETVRVPAGGTTTIAVAIRVQPAFAAAVAAAVNGTFVDGFIRLRSDTAPTLTVPYVGFYGEWSAVPMFDASLASGQAHVYGSALVNASGIPLGVNPLDDEAVIRSTVDGSSIDPDRRVVSPTRFTEGNNSVQTVTGLLRNAETFDFELRRESDGAVVGSHHFTSVTKSSYVPSIGRVLYAEARLPSTPIFRAYDDLDRELLPGEYSLVQRARTAGPGSEEQTTTATLRYDNTPARVERAALVGQGDEQVLSLVVSDDTWLASIDLQEFAGAGYFHRTLLTDPTRVDEAGRSIYEVTIPVRDIRASWNESERRLGTARELPASVMLYAWDYGLNSAPPLRTTVVESPVTGVVVDQSDVRLAPGQRQRVSATIRPENAVASETVWSSSDDAVVTVDDSGAVTGVGVGAATISVAVVGTAFAASVPVTVAEVPEDVGIIVSPGRLTLADSGTATLQAFLAASLRDATVTWASSDDGVVTVDADGAARATGRGDAVVTASVRRASGDVVSATAEIAVRQADFADYVIEDGLLRAYIGTKPVVEIPTGVRAIEDGAFSATGATSIRVPHTVERIGANAFRAMPLLQRVTIDDAADGGPASRLTSVGDSAFAGSVKLRSVNLPDSVTQLGTGVFEDTIIESMAVPSTLTAVPERTFAGATSLKHVVLGSAITEIGASAFARTRSLTEVALPESLTTIGAGAFLSSGLRSLTLPRATTHVGDSAFEGVPIETLDLGAVESVGTQSFAETGIRTLVLPDTLVSIGRAAFAYDRNLVEVTIGANVAAGTLTAVFTGAGDGPANPRLARFMVGDDVRNYSAREGILYDRSGTHLVAYPPALLAGPTLTIPDGTRVIEELALLGTAARTIVLPEGVERIGPSAFYASRLETFTAPRSLTELGDHAFSNSAQLSSVTLPAVTSIGRYGFAYNAALTDLDLGGRLVEIGDYAFVANTALTEFVVPDTVTRVGDAAFINSTELRRIHFGAGVDRIGENVLTGIPGLRELTVSADNPRYFTDQNVFYGREPDGLHLKLYLPSKAEAEYRVVPGTVAVDSQAFTRNTSIQRVVLPEGLRGLGVGAFNGTSALVDVVLPNSLEEVDGFYFDAALRTLDFGPNIRSFGEFWSMGTDLEHLVVRGGKNATFSNGFGLGQAVPQTAYFGPGMTTVDYTENAPRAIVVPRDLEKLQLAEWSLPADLVVHAEPESPGWEAAAAGLRAVGLDPAERLKAYVPLTVTIDVGTGDGGLFSVTARPTGGLVGDAGGYAFRFLQTAPGGGSTVLQDWSTDATYSGAVPVGSAITAEVRDTTRLTAAASRTAGQSAPVVLTHPTDLRVSAGEEAVFTSSATGLPEPSVQWQARHGDGPWADIVGATSGSLSLTRAEDGTVVRAVFTNELGSATSREATLDVSDVVPGEPGGPGEGGEPVGTPAAPLLSEGNRGGAVVTTVAYPVHTVSLGPDRAETWVGVTAHGATARFLGWVRTDTTGTVSVTVPEGVTGGQRLSFVDRDGVLLGWVDARTPAPVDPGQPGVPDGSGGPDGVVPGSPGPGSAQPGGAGAPQALAVTGSAPNPVGLLLVALAALGGGAACVLGVREVRARRAERF